LGTATLLASEFTAGILLLVIVLAMARLRRTEPIALAALEVGDRSRLQQRYGTRPRRRSAALVLAGSDQH
jgi:hypothetical protein